MRRIDKCVWHWQKSAGVGPQLDVGMIELHMLSITPPTRDRTASACNIACHAQASDFIFIKRIASQESILSRITS
jgi:hypothetical protein